MPQGQIHGRSGIRSAQDIFRRGADRDITQAQVENSHMEFISDVARHLVDATGLQRGFPLVHTVQHRIELRPVGKRVHQGTEGTVEGGHITHAKTQELEKENCDLVHFFRGCSRHILSDP